MNGFASPRTARHYDGQLWLEREALGAALELLDAQPHERLLDLATGTGAVLHALARRPRRPRRALGLDASPAMLARVGSLPDGWTVRAGDATATGLPAGSVELVTCTYLVHLLDAPSRAALLREITRVLTPGGRVVIVSLLAPRGAAGRTVLGPLQRGLCRWLGRGSGWCACDPSTELAAAGLRPRRARRLTRGYASLCLLAERAPSPS